MAEAIEDIFTEPEDIDPNTLANLGPLTGLAGIWEGTMGVDIAPKAPGPERRVFHEHSEFHPIDPQTNGPQLFYGLRYHTQIRAEGEEFLFHNQLGFWLWEPATNVIIQTLAIPRGQIAMAQGIAEPGAKKLHLHAMRGSTEYGICSNVFIEHAFRTDSYTLDIVFNNDGSWSYAQDTVMMVQGQKEPFHHKDNNRMVKIGEPLPNPAMQAKK